MNKILIISLIFLIYSCNKNKNVVIVKTDNFYYLSTQYYNNKIDTIPYSVGNEIPYSVNYVAKSYLPTNNSISVFSFTEKIKILSKYVVFIKVK